MQLPRIKVSNIEQVDAGIKSWLKLVEEDRAWTDAYSRWYMLGERGQVGVH